MTDSADRQQRSDITQWLAEARAGRRDSLGLVFERLYPELRRLAQSRLSRGERTLSPTVLVHESWLRLSRNQKLDLVDRHHFMATAARAMRAVVIDHVRAERAGKRGGDAVTVTLGAALDAVGGTDADLLALDQALDALDALDPAQRELVELHFFGGLEFQEIAAARGVNEKTVRRHWQRARAFLLAQLADSPG
jgi:RNA polymerase sigma factor (TIGR02999 family)